MPASVIFSTLDERVITRERCILGTNRRVKSLSLPLLPVDNSTDLLQTIAIATLKELGLEEQVDRELLRHGCRVLAAAGLGHGRTIEYMASALKDEIIRQRLDWLAGDVFDSEPIIRAAISAVWETYGREGLAPTEVLVAAVLGKLVRSGDIAFLRNSNSQEVTWGECVRRGILLGSLQDDGDEAQFVPQLSLISMGAAAQSYKRTGRGSLGEAALGDHLAAILRLSGRKGGVGAHAAFETAHGRWECAVRLCRSAAAGFNAIVVKDLYKGARLAGEIGGGDRGIFVASNTHLLQSVRVRADSTMPLQFQVFEDLEELRCPPPDRREDMLKLLHRVWKPKNSQQPGFDLVMFYDSIGGGDDSTPVLPVALQLKWSRTGVSTPLTKKAVDDAVADIRAEFGKVGWDRERLPVVFVCWRKIPAQVVAAAPANCMFLDREHLEALYGPSLAPFLGVLENDMRLVRRPGERKGKTCQ
ncbi:unnamed protein product [Phaeothamnion confervicola]